MTGYDCKQDFKKACNKDFKKAAKKEVGICIYLLQNTFLFPVFPRRDSAVRLLCHGWGCASWCADCPGSNCWPITKRTFASIWRCRPLWQAAAALLVREVKARHAFILRLVELNMTEQASVKAAGIACSILHMVGSKAAGIACSIPYFPWEEEMRWEEMSWDKVRRAQMRWSVQVWSAGREECSVKCGVWNVKCEVWSVKKAVRSVKCGLWSVKCGKCEVWSATSAVWSVKCGVWSVKCGVWRVQWEVWSAKCEVELQMWHVKQDTTFAESTHARAWLAHGACKFYR